MDCGIVASHASAGRVYMGHPGYAHVGHGPARFHGVIFSRMTPFQAGAWRGGAAILMRARGRSCLGFHTQARIIGSGLTRARLVWIT